MRRARLGAALSLALLGTNSCSFMTDFELDGKPCGADRSCRDGFVCVQVQGGGLQDLVCIHVDAGAPAGGDAGPARDGG